MAAPERTEIRVEVEGRQLTLSNLQKVMYPRTGTTKAEVLNYYAQVAPVMLPHLCERPLTLKRMPHGIHGDFFYEKNAPGHRPDWVRTATIPIRTDGRTIDFARCEEQAGDLDPVPVFSFLGRASAHPRRSLQLGF